MKKYRFRLQRVLDIKEVIQQIRERELANSLNVLESEQLVLDNHREKLQTYQDEIRGRKRLSIFEMRFYSSYLTLLIFEIQRQINRISECEKEVEDKKKKLEWAYKERQAIKNLKQRTREEYIRDFDKDQQIQGDEISLSKYFLPEELIPKLDI